MYKLIYVDNLPDKDLQGPGMKPKTDYAKGCIGFVHRHASEAGLCLAIISFAMVVLQ